MSSRTRIVVLRMKEIIYTAIFVGFALLLVILFLFMFKPKSGNADNASAAASSDKVSAASDASYTPGLYSSAITLGSQNVNIEVAVDAGRINSITMTPLSDSVETMYPLMQPAMDSLAEQIIASQSLEGIEYPAGSQYTSMALMKAIETALEKAAP